MESCHVGYFYLAKQRRSIMKLKGKTVALGQNGHVVAIRTEQWNFRWAEVRGQRVSTHTLKEERQDETLNPLKLLPNIKYNTNTEVIL